MLGRFTRDVSRETAMIGRMYPESLQMNVPAGQAGLSYTGMLWLTRDKHTFDVGLSPTPSEAGVWFGAVAPAVPKFARIFAPPGAGLPSWTGPAISALPEGCLPWVSHKDPVPMADIAEYWRAMPAPPQGSRYRWTYHHEMAPADTDARVAYFRYWRNLQEAAQDFPAVELVQIQSNYAMRWRPDTEWRTWLIGGITVGFDCYPLAHYRYEPPESMFGLLQHAADTIQAPSWGVPELGADRRDGQSRNTWMLDCFGYLEAQGASFCGLWCARDDETGLDYRPTDDGLLSVYRGALGA